MQSDIRRQLYVSVFDQLNEHHNQFRCRIFYNCPNIVTEPKILIQLLRGLRDLIHEQIILVQLFK